jgi:hypothetical protein
MPTNLLTFDAQKAAHKIARAHALGGNVFYLGKKPVVDFDRRAAEAEARATFDDNRADLVCRWLRMITAVACEGQS